MNGTIQSPIRWSTRLAKPLVLLVAASLATSACDAVTDPSMQAEWAATSPMASASASIPRSSPSPRVEFHDRPAGGPANLINDEDGYAVRLPDEWAANPRPLDLASTGSVTVVDGRHDGTFYSRVLTISVGKSDGSVPVCDRGLCREVFVRNLDDLGNALASASELCPVEETRVDVILDGERWQLEKPEYRSSCLGVPAAKFHVFGFHGGRPFVLAFDYWVIRFNRFEYPPTSEWATGWGPVGQIIDSFRFLDTRPSSRWQDYHSDHHGYEVEVPSGWIAEETPLSGVTYFYNDQRVALVVSVGDASGRITICPGGQCRRVVVERLDELDQLLPPYDTRQVSPFGNEVRDVALLDGRRALVTRPEPPIGMVSWLPGWAYAFAVNPGRPPIVLRFSSGGMRQATDGVLTDLQARIVHSFALD